jgi:hypothetical protein
MAFHLSHILTYSTYSASGELRQVRITRACFTVTVNSKTKQAPRPLVRERNIQTERPPLVDQI